MDWFAGGGRETEREVQAQGRSMRDSWQTVEELLEAKPAELSGAQTSSTADRLSEMEVLRIVRGLNEGSTNSWLACPRNGRNWSTQCRFLIHSQSGKQAFTIDAGGGTTGISTYGSSVAGRYGSKSCSNPSVSRIYHDCRFFRLTTFILGLIQGGELVTD